MNSNRVMAGMWLVAISFVSYYAIKNKFWPYPPTLVRVSLSFAVFGIMGLALPEIATGLAGGFLLAGFLNLYQRGLANYSGGNQPNGIGLGQSRDGALSIPLNLSSGGK